ncbi:MAG: hypothetical protein ABJJ09_14135 [Ascidiaceihabitans sp.]|uniref:hypothetical protein n=1 Tax=Ascidiaceihabitans sp. TaxID=1872644 RepID=UPI003298E0E1
MFDTIVIRLRFDVAVLPHLRKGTFAYFTLGIFKGLLQASFALIPLAICFAALMFLADWMSDHPSWLGWLSIPINGMWVAGVIYLNWVFWTQGRPLRRAWQHGNNDNIRCLLEQRIQELEHLT